MVDKGDEGDEQCSICLSSEPILVQLCETCKPSLTCHEDLDKYIHGYYSRSEQLNTSGHGFKCMFCKVSVQRLKFYFAGKIVNYTDDGCQGLDPHDRIIMREISSFMNLEEPIKYDGTRPDYITTGPCIFISSYSCNKCGGKPATRKGHYPMDCDDCGFTGTDMVYEEDGTSDSFDGFTFKNNPLEKSEKTRQILNKRNKEMIMNCDVFSLEINQAGDCERAKMEFGQAEILGKILVISFQKLTTNFYNDFWEWRKDNDIYESDGIDEEIIARRQRKAVRLYIKYFEDNDIDYKDRVPSSAGHRRLMELFFRHSVYLPLIKKKEEALLQKYSEYYLNIQDCIDSMNKLDNRMKELIIYCHPVLGKRFKGGSKEYLSYLRKIASHKK